MKKTVKALLAMVMAAILVFSAIPVSAASVSDNYNAVVKHIETEGQWQESLNGKVIYHTIEEEGIPMVFMLANTDEGVILDVVLVYQGDINMIVGTGFILKKTGSYTDVEYMIALLQGEKTLDELVTTKTINHTQFTTSSSYTINKSSTYIDSKNATQMFNATLQMLCAFWDAYFGEALGFGLKGLGFTKYDGYEPAPCEHAYDNDCDTTCNLCGETRETSHSFTSWQKVDENSHSRTCGSCKKEETRSHGWVIQQIIHAPTQDADGTIAYVCNDCGAEKTIDVRYTPGDMDCDGVVDNRDVEYLLWYTLFPEDYPLLVEADYDDNGAVDNLDVEYLLWHTLFPEDYPV